MDALGWIVSYLIVGIVGTVARGWTLAVLWGWFVVPTFHLPALGIAPALGLGIVVGYLTKQDIDVKAPERTNLQRFERLVSLCLAGPALALGVGCVVHLFMGTA